jgi:hypothetical protein
MKNCNGQGNIEAGSWSACLKLYEILWPVISILSIDIQWKHIQLTCIVWKDAYSPSR